MNISELNTTITDLVEYCFYKSKQNVEIMENLKILDREIDEYEIINDKTISGEERQQIKNYYETLKKIHNNKIYIEKKTNLDIRIRNTKIIVLQNMEVLHYGVDSKSTLYFENCSNMTIVVDDKAGHITLNRCCDVNIRTIGGSISGIDIFGCSKINAIFEKGSVYNIEIGDSEKIKIVLSVLISPKTQILTIRTYVIDCIISDCGINIKEYKLNRGYFDIYKKYIFSNVNPSEIEDITHKINDNTRLSTLPVFLNSIDRTNLTNCKDFNF